ncbi:MAG: DVU0150 family protein [Desulfoferrobacter sp.]
MKSLFSKIFSLCMMAYLVLPAMALAAGGGGASELVVVADTRRISGIMKYFANLYNTNILLFAIWAVVLTAAYGCFLGLVMDFFMSRTGLDLKSRKIVEH